MLRHIEISTRTERDTHIVDVVGQIDMGSSLVLRKALLEALGGTKRLAINLTGVTYIDSSGIASLVELLKEARKSGKRIILYGVSSSVLQVLQLTRLTGVFEIKETEAQALED